MALTYVTLDKFKAVKEIEASDSAGERVISDYLIRATREIDRATRRHFFPRRQQRDYTLPAEFLLYRRREFPGADLWLDDDLLEIVTVEVGEPGDTETLTEGIHFETMMWNTFPKFALRLKWPNFWTGSMAVFTPTRWRLPTIFVTAIWGFHELYEEEPGAWVDTNVDLGATLAANATTFDVGAATTDDLGDTDIAVGELIKIDDEYLEIVSITGTTTRTVTVRRARQGTTAASHATGTSIYKWDVHGDIKQACFMIAKAWREHDQSKGGRAGMSDMSVGVELDIPADAKRILIDHMRSVVSPGVY